MSQAQVNDVVCRVWAEYRQMPGLALDVAQAGRLWNLDERLCQRILDTLVELQLLLVTSRSTYVRRDRSDTVTRLSPCS
jgi:hypothetical protein